MYKKARRIALWIFFIMICMCIKDNCVAASSNGMDGKKIAGGKRDFTWPVPGNYNIMSCFLDPDAVTVTYERTSLHYAIDIAATIGTDVVAAYNGTVIETVDKGTDYKEGFGNYVVIQHDGYQLVDGSKITLYTRYSHLNSVSVSKGAVVKAGEIVGKVGKTGVAYGPHLDFQILRNNWRDYMNNSLDPYSNELLELPNSIYKSATTSCCANYIASIKNLYSGTPSTGENGVETVVPTNVQLALEKNTFFENEHVTYYCAGDNASYYIITIYDSQGNVLESVQVNQGGHYTRYHEAGSYTAYCEAFNSCGRTFSNTVQFTVKECEKPTNVVIALEKSSFLTTEHVTYYCAGDNVSYYIITIYDSQGNVLESVQVNQGGYYTRYHEEGSYTAYCEAFNSYGKTFSNTISFEIKTSEENTKPHEHSYTLDTETSATCVANGKKVYICSGCGDTKTEVIQAKGHSMGSWKITKDATCTSTGINERTCTNGCGEKETQTVNKKDHDYKNGSCTECGTKDPDYVPTPEVNPTAPQIIVDTLTASAGETVDVKISLKNNPGIASMKLNVSYDSILTLESVTYNSQLGGQSQQPQNMSNPVVLNWFNGSANTTGDKAYAILKFRVSDNVKEGAKAQISVSYNPDDVFNIAENNIEFAVVNGAVDVISYIPGDVNGDKVVNNKDLTRLFQYLSDWEVEVVDKALDVNGDGNVNNKDVTRLFQYLSNWNVEIY